MEELLEIGGSFRANMFRNTELASIDTPTAKAVVFTIQFINKVVRDKIVISLEKMPLK